MHFVDVLPSINASLNGLATVLLTVGFFAVKTGRIPLHRRCMVSAFSVSALFLVSYVLHKYLVQGAHTPFEGEGVWQPVYYTMLISHILLAILIVPLALTTLSLALRKKWSRHKAWARWTFPIWYYVSVTGVLIYCFLYQWF
ncbi:MAG: DUF420 domain-containing protein [Opitutales bacterium]